MKRRSFLGTAAVSLLGLSLPFAADAQPPPPPAGAGGPRPPLRGLPPGQWELLAERRVSFRVQRDIIPVGRREGRFTAIMLDVLGRHAVEITSFVVVFGNGERREIEVREVIQPETRTRVIDLPGGVRNIQRIELVYRGIGGGRRGRAHVRVFGMR